MATTERRADKGRARARAVMLRLVRELVDRRRLVGMSQVQLGALVGWSQSQVSRFERLVRLASVTFVDLNAIAAVLGYELGANLFPAGEPVRDKGHQALIARFRAMLAPLWNVAAEVLLPLPGDRRAWDLLLRLVEQRVGVEAETRLRDVQAFVRRIRERERDGGVDVIVIVLAESATNRRLLPQLLEALGPAYATPARSLLNALREGRPLAGCGVVLI